MKNTALMTDMGLEKFCQSADSLDSARLIAQFRELDERSAELAQTLGDRWGSQAQRLQEQFGVLSGSLFAVSETVTQASPARQVWAEADSDRLR